MRRYNLKKKCFYYKLKIILIKKEYKYALDNFFLRWRFLSKALPFFLDTFYNFISISQYQSDMSGLTATELYSKFIICSPLYDILYNL